MQLTPQQRKGIFIAVLSGLFLLICYFLWVPFSPQKEAASSLTENFNMELPHPELSTLSSNRVDALKKEQQAQEMQTRLEQVQASSFDWYNAPPSETMTNVAEEELTSQPVPSVKEEAHSLLPADFEVTRQRIMVQKRQELERALGLSSSPEESSLPVSSPSVSSPTSSSQKKPVQVQKWRENSSAGFYGLQQEDPLPSTDIRAVVHGAHKNVEQGSMIKFRLLDDLNIEGTHIPANTFFYGRVSFANGRAMVHCEYIPYRQKVYPFSASVFDKDGFEGLYLPNNHWDETKRELGSNVLSSTSLTVPTTSLVGMATNAITSGLQQAAQKAVRQQKLSISANYQVILHLQP